MTNTADIINEIKAEAGLTDPAQIALLSRILVDYTTLQARALAGEDVEKELKVVTASSLNLSEHVRNVAFVKFSNWLTATLVKVLTV